MSEYIAKCSEVIGISGNPIKVPDYINLNSEIIRCRDCTWFHWDDSGRWCAQSLVRRSDPDGFCAWAERREQ